MTDGKVIDPDDYGLRHRLGKILLSPWSVLAGVLAGLSVGRYGHDWVPVVAPLGHVFLNTLKMCVLPILVSAIATSLGRLIQNRSGGGFLGRAIPLFLTALVVVGMLGTIAGLAGKPGAELGSSVLEVLGTHVSGSKYAPDIEISLTEPQTVREPPPSAKQLVDTLIPRNIFHALTNDNHLQVLFFAILFGVALGLLPEATCQPLATVLDGLYKAFAKVVDWLRYLLPLGLCGLMAEQFAQTGAEILVAMGRFLLITLTSYLFLLVLGIGLIWIRSREPLRRVVAALKDPIIIALGTGASLPAIPSSLTALTRSLGFSKDRVDLLVPLTITVCRFGNVLYFAVATLFVAQLYQVALGPQQLLVVVLGAVVAGMATAGTSGIMTLVMLSLVLRPLGLPLDAVLALFIVIDPVVGPARAMTNVQLNLALSTLLAGRSGRLPA
jgi:proton glutamate symport protein